MSEQRRVVAVQLAVKLGQIERNLEHIEDVVGQAVKEHSPDMVFLPEVSTTPNICHRAMPDCARPVAGAPLRLYRRLAREHGVVLGAGSLSIRGTTVRNTYYVCEPDGTVHLHDKDQPSMWENAHSTGGTDDGIMPVGGGPIGCANGFEWIRTRTAARLRGNVRLLAGGMCFPSFPTWKLTHGWFWRRDHGLMLDMARETPGRMARVLGVPAVHPSHVGEITMQTPMASRIPWHTIMVGETIIAAADGTIMDRMAYADGEGYICADVPWGDPLPLDPVPDRFWMCELPVSVHVVWWATNAWGRAVFARRERAGLHPWMDDPAYGHDLPDLVTAKLADGMTGQPVEV